MKVNACIGCGDKRAESFGSSEGFHELIGEKKFSQDPYSILQCSNCGLYYKDHVLDESQLEDYYNSFDFKAWVPTGNYPTEDIVEQYLLSLSGLKVLDYGCSEGRFISKFTDRHTCYGYDIDQRALELAKDKGVSVLNIAALQQQNNMFDVIVLSDVFEHSMAPTKLVSELLSMLNERGILIISTGNADAWACQYDLPHFWYFRTVQHVCMLGKKYISFIENKFNVKIIKEIHCSHYRSGLSKKIFYGARFGVYRFVNSNRQSMAVRMVSHIPFLKKVTQWKQLPYYPYSKDHTVVFLQKQG